MTNSDWSGWDEMQWRRRLETFGDDDGPVLAAKNYKEADTVWSAIYAPQSTAHGLMLLYKSTGRTHR